ncbi:hypothetical protein MKQ68_07060 [Chitinophaga horti]|uniref:M61 family peptidase n=1 Tax=Chitinophaga horti TaxID=2920382 RepID=A0ABY6J594_9BACT|nr:hypothetical protein [Chitinophaga horti]UYQ94850.1 hypothetical protein MKQ68_07060 [Chitinophaga horti]
MLFARLLPVFLLAASTLSARQKPADIHFTVDAQRPGSAYFHVTMICENTGKDALRVKLPAWTPGYYWLINYAKNVVNFRAQSAAGKDLRWEKTNKNTWSIAGKGPITISYDVYARTQSVADAWLDSTFAYLPPASLLMHPEGALSKASTVKMLLPSSWKSSFTGLEPVKGQSHTYYAQDFDELYDCPLLLGNQYATQTDIGGRQHRLVLQDTAGIDVPSFFADLQKMIRSANELMGAVPYKHYTFLIMGDGRGGLEHRNSTAVFSGGPYGRQNMAAYKRWLNFLTHEYFHLYNIKAIRPVALGPFDYDKENLTHMLWVSEGFTVYYEYLILNRAGLLTRQDVYDMLRGSITNYENSPGHLFQSATASSFDTWLHFFNRNAHTANTTISYYDKGCALGLLLDLKIRHETGNRRSLDNVMRQLYQEFYITKRRGFTDDEFRHVCETVAGCKLSEIFEVYATTTEPVDYTKYLAYAGISVDLTPGKPFPLVFGRSGHERPFTFRDMPGMDSLQRAINRSWVVD